MVKLIHFLVLKSVVSSLQRKLTTLAQLQGPWLVDLDNKRLIPPHIPEKDVENKVTMTIHGAWSMHAP